MQIRSNRNRYIHQDKLEFFYNDRNQTKILQQTNGYNIVEKVCFFFKSNN